jgi:Ca-activated chloride channel family protein
MFHFAQPNYLFLLLLIPLFIGLFFYSNLVRKKNLNKLGNPQMLKDLMPNVSLSRQRIKFYIALGAFTLIIFSLARPQFGSSTENVKRRGIEVMIALDVSNSMLARDVSPSRLEKAKQLLSKLSENLTNDKIGVIVFAGEAQMQIPLTSDYVSAKMFLASIDPNIVSRQGTAIGSAIDLAIKGLTTNSKAGKTIILLTDAENHEDNAVDAAKLAAEKGIVVNVIGVGTPEGSPIPSEGTLSYKKDMNGNVVVSKLNEQAGKEIAAAGKGLYVRADNSNTALRAISSSLDKLATAPVESKIYSSRDEQFATLAWLAFFLLVIDILILGRQNKWVNRFKWF